MTGGTQDSSYFRIESEVTTMGKGNHSQSKEKKKPKKAAAPKSVPVKSSTPRPKKP